MFPPVSSSAPQHTPLHPSFPRKRESSRHVWRLDWIPACAGMTGALDYLGVFGPSLVDVIGSRPAARQSAHPPSARDPEQCLRDHHHARSERVRSKAAKPSSSTNFSMPARTAPKKSAAKSGRYSADRPKTQQAKKRQIILLPHHPWLTLLIRGACILNLCQEGCGPAWRQPHRPWGRETVWPRDVRSPTRSAVPLLHLRQPEQLQGRPDRICKRGIRRWHRW